MTEEIRYDKDADGIVILTFDSQGQSANTMNVAWNNAFEAAIARLQGEEGLTGVILASAKKTFFAGADLNEFLAAAMDAEMVFGWAERAKAGMRALEKLPVPVVAAINGAALGGGLELCLTCNRRIIADTPKAVVGTPEVTIGLLPGGGGCVRIPALIGLEKALPVLLEGKPLKPQAALKLGLVDEIVADTSELIPAAKAWITANPDAHTQPWDQRGFQYPGGGATAPNVRQIAAFAPTMLFNRTRGLMPGPERILDIAVNSMRMGFDSALRAESRALASLMAGPHSKAAISTFFHGMQAIKQGKVRPEGERWKAGASVVLGAGMMGGGIAWAHASAGLPTVLKDTEIAKAEKGKAYSEGLAAKRVGRGRMSEEQKTGLLELIRPTDRDDFDGTDLIIEAVFENIDLKERVIAQTFPKLGPDGIYGSNTSTLPISILAEACADPARFIGLHFFSPVDRMKVVEIIIGDKTSQETLRKAYDYVQQIGYTPIVVNDSRGFFTSRVFGTFLDEGFQLLRDGMNPVAIERAAWKAGMPVGPFDIQDQVSQELSRKVRQTHKMLDERLGVSSGFGKYNTASAEIVDQLCEMGRRGRNWDGAGCYDYPENGAKTLWPGLTQFQKGNMQIPIQDAVDRILYRQAIEALRCFEEGVINTEVEGNIGSIFAIGFPAWTGGALQFCRFDGTAAFKARADELAASYGERFTVTEAMLAKLAGEAAEAA